MAMAPALDQVEAAFMDIIEEPAASNLDGHVDGSDPSACDRISTCAMCKDALILWGGPISLACGHGLCLNCLQTARSCSPGHLYCPLCQELDEWVPVSIPPMDLEDYEKGLYQNGGGGGGGRSLFSRVKVSRDTKLGTLFAAMQELLVEYRKEKAAQMREAVNRRRQQSLYALSGIAEDVEFMRAVFEAEPPAWLPDSLASACMQCGRSFQPLKRGRHHCRFCGQIFCGECSRSKSLLPAKFRVREVERVCDTCAKVLEPAQALLAFQVCPAFQSATHDVTDYSCLRSWLNNPVGFNMENEIYKATNTLRTFQQMRLEKSIPKAVLRGARGLAVLTVLKLGMVVTYKIGTGLVVARNSDNSWSAPSAIASCGVGWGPQVGGELTDFVIVLRTEAAVRAFAGRVHLSVGAGLSLAAGPVGRLAEADVRSGVGGTAACYTYSCAKGAFIGCSLEGNVVTTRTSTNSVFYGDSLVTAEQILFGPVPQPRAASPLYDALSKL